MGCGYKLANDGIDTRAIQDWLGHLLITHTTRYTALPQTRFKAFGETERMRALLKRIKMPPDVATTPDAAKALGLHLAGYTYVEIAAELGCTPDEAYNLVRQALKAMKR